MKVIKSSGLLLIAAIMTFGGSQVAQAGDRLPLTKVLLNVEDLAKELVRLDAQREHAVAARAKAQAELDAVSRRSAPDKAQADAIQKRIKDAEDAIKRVDHILARREDDARATKHGGPNRDVTARLERLADERSKAQAARTKALAELEALKKQNVQAKEQAEELQSRIKDAEHKIRHVDNVLGKMPPITFEAANEDEVKQALQLPQKLDAIFKRVGGIEVSNKVRVEPTFNPSDKTGGIKIQWKGNP